MDFVLASTNPGKVEEFKKLLLPEIKLSNLKNFPGFPDVVEDGKSYYENALKKALTYAKFCKTAVLSDDSGVEVAALKGLPGVDSAHFGGEKISWPERRSLLLKKAKEQGQPNSCCRFICVLCYYDPKSVPIFFSGVCEGTLCEEKSTEHGFGYDPVFFSNELKKTFGEASAEEKSKVSHRARAVSAFNRWWISHRSSL